MSVADEKYKELVLDIYENGSWDYGQDVRGRYEDGTPAYSKSVFGRQVVFEEGEMPILTTKHVGWKTALKETILFWIQQTVKKEDFEDANVKVWDEWFLDDNTLGKSYAYQFESRPKKEIIKVAKKTVKAPQNVSPIVGVCKLEEPNLQNKASEEIGSVLKSNYGQEYIILQIFKSDTHYKKNKSAYIQFLDSGYKNLVLYSHALKGEVDDIFRRSHQGVGYLGEFQNVTGYTDSERKTLSRRWGHMIDRCYNVKNTGYNRYGGKGVFVSERWHSLENYLKDVKKLPQFFLAKIDEFKGWELDKDYYGSNCYSLETCVWIPHQENKTYAGKPFYAYKKNISDSRLYISLSECANSIDASGRESDISQCLNNKYGRHTVNGYQFSYVEENDHLFRYNLSNNQVVDLISNIKNNPSSRRLMTSFWNDADVSYKALQECAMQTTWNVRDGKLDVILYSRSVDTALGLPFNWIQYWFLQQMVSQATGLKSGRFIHQMGNVHYYDRHEKTLLQQVKSETHEQPVFEINNNIDDYFQFSVEDIKLINYNNNGKFEYEVAI